MSSSSVYNSFVRASGGGKGGRCASIVKTGSCQSVSNQSKKSVMSAMISLSGTRGVVGNGVNVVLEG